jgi:Kef-type K+ transport system membrane component KefB
MLMTLSAVSFLFAIAMAFRAKDFAQRRNQKSLVLSILASICLALIGGGFFWLGSTYPNAIPMATSPHVG